VIVAGTTGGAIPWSSIISRSPPSFTYADIVAVHPRWNRAVRGTPSIGTCQFQPAHFTFCWLVSPSSISCPSSSYENEVLLPLP
jgi:hypothetical protein